MKANEQYVSGYVCWRTRKNMAAIIKAQNVLDRKSEYGTEQYFVQYMPDETSRFDDVISELDMRIADTQRDINVLEKDSDDKLKYEKDLEELTCVRERVDRRRKRLHKPEWTPPIED